MSTRRVSGGCLVSVLVLAASPLRPPSWCAGPSILNPFAVVPKLGFPRPQMLGGDLGA